MCRWIILIALANIASLIFAASPLEGEWQINNGGARLRFVPQVGHDDVFDIVWVDGPDFSILPGTVVGSAVAAPDAGVYDCRVSADPRGKGDKYRHARFVIRLDDATGDSFTFDSYEQKVKISPQALLPYWWRRPVKTINNRPRGLDGARRVDAPAQFVEL